MQVYRALVKTIYPSGRTRVGKVWTLARLQALQAHPNCKSVLPGAIGAALNGARRYPLTRLVVTDKLWQFTI